MIKKKYAMSALRSILLFAVLVAVSSISDSLIRAAGSVKEFRGFWSSTLFDRVNFFYSLLVLFSLSNVFILNDPILKSDFESRNGVGRLSFTLKKPYFWIEYAFFVSCVALFFFFPPFISLSDGFFLGFDEKTKYLLTVLTMLPTAFLIKLVSYQSTLAWWEETSKKRKNKSERKSGARFVLKLFLYFLIYSAGGFAVSIACPMLLTAFSILGALKFSVVVIAVVLIIASFFLSSLIRRSNAVNQRRKLIKKLTALGKEYSFSFEKGKKPYTSAHNDNAYNFLLKMKDRRIACRFVSAAKKSIPVYLHENGDAIYEDKGILFKHTVTQKYAFDADNGFEKIIVVCPCNANVFITNGREERLADSGDRCMEYKIYNSSGLLNAIERGYL